MPKIVWGPFVGDYAANGTDIYAQGTLPIGVSTIFPASMPGQVSPLTAARSPVLNEISVGMSGEEAAGHTVSGVPPLSLPDSLGYPLLSWSVDLSPYQEGSGDPSPNNVRPIHGTDKVTIYTDSKYGGLVEWNQIVKNGDFATSTVWVNEPGTSSSMENNIVTITTSTPNNGIVQTGVPVAVGDKFYIHAEAYLTQSKKIAVGASGSYGLQIEQDVVPNKWNTLEAIKTCTSAPGSGTVSIYIFGRNTTFTDGQFKNYFICNLTQMFGAGNEPTTVEAFRALFPNEYYAYNSGTQMTVDQVNGAQYTPAVITLPQTVYTGTVGSEGGEVTWGNIASYNGETLTGEWISSMDVYAAGTTPTIGAQVVYELSTPTTFAVPSATIPTPRGTANAWATAEDGTVDSMEVTYVGEA